MLFGGYIVWWSMLEMQSVVEISSKWEPDEHRTLGVGKHSLK